jgi:TolA-binding protein
MLVKDRRGGMRNWVPGLFAAFWVLLAAFSGAYLFRIVTDATAHRTETATANPVAAATPMSPAGPPPTESPALSANQANALLRANEAKDRELTELKSQLRDLSGQVAELNTRLKPLEKVLGPVAALPSSAAVTTSLPSPEPMRPAEKPPEPPKPEAKSASPEVPVKPSDQAKAVEKPSDSAKPAEKPSDQAMATETPANHDKVNEAKPPKPSEQASGKPNSPDQNPREKTSEPVQVTSNEPVSTNSAASTGIANLGAPPPIPPGTTRFGIEIGSVEKQDKVRPMWRDLLTNHAALVAGLQARRIIAPDKKWRLIAGPFSSAAEAMQACALFKKANMPCEATVFAGDAL